MNSIVKIGVISLSVVLGLGIFEYAKSSYNESEFNKYRSKVYEFSSAQRQKCEEERSELAKSNCRLAVGIATSELIREERVRRGQ